MTSEERQKNVLRFVYALKSLSNDLTELKEVSNFKHYGDAELKEAIGDLISLMPFLMRKWRGSDDLEGKLYLNENNELELAKRISGCPAGSDIEINVCSTWIKTKVESVGKTFYAAGLKGFPLVGVLARMSIEEKK